MKEETTKPLRLYIYTHVHLKNEKGITLIAVVVSLVILIILALIGIRIAFNDDGVFRSASKSVEVQSNSIMKDRELANTYVTEVENSELKLAVEQKEKSTPASNNQYTTGEEVKYEVTITNTGEKNLVDLELTDTLIRPDRTEGTPSGLPGGTTVIDRLEVNESKVVPITHTVEEKDLGGDLKNAVRVVGYAEDNPKESAEAESKVTVATVGSNENLEIAKEVISNPASPKGYMTGEEIIYKVTVKNKGKTTESNIIIDDEIKRLLQSGEEDPIEHWTFDTFYNVESGEETNQLGPGESGYRIYSYTVQQKDLGKTLINNAKIRGKNKVPPGEKPVNPDKPSGSIAITKSVSTEGMVEGHEQEAKSHAYTFTLNVTKNGAPVTETLYYTDENNTRKTIQSGGTFTLKDKQKITITGIPDGADYRIKEEVYQIQNSGYYMESDKEEYTGTINLASSTEGLITIECTNKEVPGLEIVKEVVSKPKYKKDAYMVGETVEYQIKITNIGRVDIAVTEIILDDALKRLKANGEIDPIQNWTFDTLYEDKETTKPIAKTNTLKPEQVAYTKKYSYTIVSEDLGHTLINNVKIRKKLIPPGEKPVKPDVPTGTLTITKAYYEEENIITGAKFKITLRDQTGKELTEDKFPYYYGNVESGTITSGGTFTLDNGEGYTIAGLPDGTKFTVQEIEVPAGYNLNTEAKEGTINLSKSLAESISFINMGGSVIPNDKGILADSVIYFGKKQEMIDWKYKPVQVYLYQIATCDVTLELISDSEWIKDEEKGLLIYQQVSIEQEQALQDPKHYKVVNSEYNALVEKWGGKSILDVSANRGFIKELANYVRENDIEPMERYELNDTTQICPGVTSFEHGIYLWVADGGIGSKYVVDNFTPNLLFTQGSMVSLDGIPCFYRDEVLGCNLGATGAYIQRYGDLEIVTGVNTADVNNVSATPIAYEVTARIDGEKVYSNIVSIDISEAGQQPINISREIPAGAEVTVKCIYSGNYNLLTMPEQTVVIGDAENMESVAFEYDFSGTNKIVTSVTNLFSNNGDGWKWNKDKEKGIGANTENIQIELENENPSDLKISDIVRHVGLEDVFIRMKILAPEEVRLDVSGEFTSTQDGYYYLEDIIRGGSSKTFNIKLQNMKENGEIVAGDQSLYMINGKVYSHLKQPDEFVIKAPESLNVVVIVEATKVQYDENGNPYADWNAVNDSGNEGGA